LVAPSDNNTIRAGWKVVVVDFESGLLRLHPGVGRDGVQGAEDGFTDRKCRS